MYQCANFNQPRIFIGRIPKGYAGTKKAVELIAHLVWEGAKDFRVRQAAFADPDLRTEVLFQKGKYE